MRNYAKPLPSNPEYAKNPYILKWWEEKHDQLLITHIKKEQWIWYWSIAEKISEITDKNILETWQKKDPVCKQYVWYNVLMYFASARAEEKGYFSYIRKPLQKECASCKKEFSEAFIFPSIARRLTFERIDVCNDCVGVKFAPQSGNDSLSEKEIIKFLQDVVSIIEVIPPQSFGETLSSLTYLTTEQRVEILKVFENKPTIRRVKEVFGSWLNALIQAQLLEDGTRKTSRGIQTIALDGHLCLSLGERTIDDYLYLHGIQHEKEPRYPEGNYRCDFKVGTIFIEYFGLTGNPDYDAKTKEKIRLCKKHNIVLVAIYPQDLTSQKTLERKLSALITNV